MIIDVRDGVYTQCTIRHALDTSTNTKLPGKLFILVLFFFFYGLFFLKKKKGV